MGENFRFSDRGERNIRLEFRIIFFIKILVCISLRVIKNKFIVWVVVI